MKQRKIKEKLLRTAVALAVMVFTAVSSGISGGITAAAVDTSAKLSVPQSVSEGESFRITVTFTSNVNIGSVKARLDYDDNVIEFVSGDFASGGGGLCLINGWSEEVGKTSSFELDFKAVRTGSSQIHLEQAAVYSDIGDLIGAPEASASITVSVQSPAVQTTTVTTTAPAQTDKTTSETSQSASEPASTTTTPEITSGVPAASNTDNTEQEPSVITVPGDEEATGDDLPDVTAGEDESSSSKNDSSEAERSDNKGTVTAILLIVGCIAIACIIMAGDGKGKKKRSSRSRRK